MTVNELLEGTIEFDMRGAAHAIYWAIREGHVNGNDDISKLREIKMNTSAISWLSDENVLGVERIKLFVIRTGTEDLYAFYFAENAADASQLHNSLFGEVVTNISNGTRLMPKPMHFAKQDYDMTFFDYRKQVIEYPCYIGHARSGESVCYQLAKRGA